MISIKMHQNTEGVLQRIEAPPHLSFGEYFYQNL